MVKKVDVGDASVTVEKMDVMERFEAEMRHHVLSLREIEGKGLSHVESVYEGAVVFITGATGFIGKQLVEKLLRACPGIKKIYLLFRSKKGRDLNQRLDRMVEDTVYEELRTRCPDFRSRLVPVEGDISSPRLGLKNDVWTLLTEEVNFIFHVAATVRFDEPLKKAVHTNVRSTIDTVNLAKDCKDLRCLIYVSSAYAHCNRTEIEEKFYECPVKPEDLIRMVDEIEDKELEALTPKLIKGWPNTYTFSKSLGEEVVRRMCQGMPVCIIRPAVVVPAYQEPTPGWLDMNTIYGPSGALVGSSLGILRVVWVDPDVSFDFVPVDLVNNLTIAASWDTVQRHVNGETEIKIYTISRKRNPETWNELTQRCLQLRDQIVSPKSVWLSEAKGIRNFYMYWIYVFFLHWLPSAILDPILALTGSKLRLRAVHAKIYKQSRSLSFFNFNSFIHHDENTLQLHNQLSKIDQDIFKFNISEMDPVKFTKSWYVGIRRYILKDGLKGTAWGMKKQFWFRKLNLCINFLYIYCFYKVCFLLLEVFTYCFYLFW